MQRDDAPIKREDAQAKDYTKKGVAIVVRCFQGKGDRETLQVSPIRGLSPACLRTQCICAAH